MKIFSSLLMSYEWQLYAWSLNFGGRGFDHWKKVGVIIDMDFLSLDFNDALRLLSHEISIVKILFSLIWILKLVLQNLNFPNFLVKKFGLSIWKMTWLKVVLVGTPILALEEVLKDNFQLRWKKESFSHGPSLKNVSENHNRRIMSTGCPLKAESGSALFWF